MIYTCQLHPRGVSRIVSPLPLASKWHGPSDEITKPRPRMKDRNTSMLRQAMSKYCSPSPIVLTSPYARIFFSEPDAK